jgi:peptidoglycan L-alanyl-D-glutamate endopeptidase CwlK
MTRRQKFRKGLHPLYLPIYDSICTLLPDEFQPYFGLRSFEMQTKLYAKGRTEAGSIVTYARAGQSPHNYGCASDWCIWDDNGTVTLRDDIPQWNKKDPKWGTYKWACQKSGGKWLGESMGDYPHNELSLAVPWGRVKIAYDAGGMDEALKFIEKNLQ